MATLCDFWGDNKLERYQWGCNYDKKTPHESTQRRHCDTFQCPFFPCSKKEELRSIQSSWSQQPSVGTSLPLSFPPSTVLRHTWGSSIFHRVPMGSITKNLRPSSWDFYPKSVVLYVVHKRYEVYTLILFSNSFQNFFMDILLLFKNKRAYIPNPCKFRYILYI